MVGASFGWAYKRKNKLANIEMGEGDFGWRWVIKYWELLANNPCQVEGMITLVTELEGMVELESDLEGLVGSTT